MARIAVDIDGVLASKLENGNYPEDYVKKEPIDGAVKGLEILKKEGFHITLFTARWEEDREVTVAWLKEHGFEGLYDELVMDKLHYDILIDDRAIRHTNWFSNIAKVGLLKRQGKWY